MNPIALFSIYLGGGGTTVSKFTASFICFDFYKVPGSEPGTESAAMRKADLAPARRGLTRTSSAASIILLR